MNRAHLCAGSSTLCGIASIVDVRARRGHVLPCRHPHTRSTYILVLQLVIWCFIAVDFFRFAEPECIGIGEDAILSRLTYAVRKAMPGF